MIKIYTDGSCLNNPGDGGGAAIINNDGVLDQLDVDAWNMGYPYVAQLILGFIKNGNYPPHQPDIVPIINNLFY